MNHVFDVDMAKDYGLLEAVLISNFEYWLAHNKANKINFHDGKYWTFNSGKAFAELFPYASKRQVEYALKKLKDAGVIETGNYNKDKRDKTLWYTFTDEFAKCRLQNCDMDATNSSHAHNDDVIALPNINTDINTDIKQDTIPYTEIIMCLNNRTGASYRATSKRTRDLIKARFNEGFTLDDFKVVIDKKSDEWLDDKNMSKFLRPETLFGNKFESYLNQPSRKMTTKDLAKGMDFGFMGDVL